MLVVTAECKRVLKNTGILMWNHGDCYGSKPAGNPGSTGLPNKCPSTTHLERADTTKCVSPKCLALQNFRLVLRMIDDQNWILRNTVIWNKPNSMPSSVTDRFSNSYEPVFMFSKTNKAQFYVNQKTLLMQRQKPLGIKGEENVDWEWRNTGRSDIQEAELTRISEDRGIPRQTAGILVQSTGDGKLKNVSPWRSVNYFFDLDAVREPAKSYESEMRRSILDNKGKDHLRADLADRPRDTYYHSSGKNPGDVWTINTQPRPEKHFAAFPDRLAARVIQVGCPLEVCPECGLPRVRVSSRECLEYRAKPYTACTAHIHHGEGASTLNNSPVVRSAIGFSHCSCNVPYEPGIILDPFLGRGTVAVVAKHLGRDYVGIELNEEYVKMAEANINLPIKVKRKRQSTVQMTSLFEDD